MLTLTPNSDMRCFLNLATPAKSASTEANACGTKALDSVRRLAMTLRIVVAGTSSKGAPLVGMGDGGSVALSFRGATTRPLAWDSSSATVRAALLELPTLRGGAGDEAFGDQREMLPRPLNAQLTGRAVSVLYDNDATTLCAASGVTAIIQFNQDFGDIPLLVPDATELTHSSIIIQFNQDF